MWLVWFFLCTVYHIYSFVLFILFYYIYLYVEFQLRLMVNRSSEGEDIENNDNISIGVGLFYFTIDNTRAGRGLNTNLTIWVKLRPISPSHELCNLTQDIVTSGPNHILSAISLNCLKISTQNTNNLYR